MDETFTNDFPWCIPQNDLNGEAPPGRGTFFMLHERVGKSVTSAPLSVKRPERVNRSIYENEEMIVPVNAIYAIA